MEQGTHFLWRFEVLLLGVESCHLFTATQTTVLDRDTHIVHLVVGNAIFTNAVLAIEEAGVVSGYRRNVVLHTQV